MNEPIRVLCVMSTLDRGGAETMCMNLYRCIDRSKVQFDFVKHTHEKGAYEDEIKSLGGRIFEAPRYKIINHFEYTNWWKKHLCEHPEHKIIHGHFFGISSIYLKVAKEYGCETITHSHATYHAFHGAKERIKQYMCSKAENYSDYAFACSKEAGEWVFPHKPFTVLNNAVDSELFRFSNEIRERVRRAFNISDELVVGTVASMQEVKNPFGLIEIFENIIRQKPDAKLIWVGSGGMRPKIEEKLAEKGIEKNVILTGVRSDVNELLQAMDAFLLPSFSEGLPVSAIEAQTAGLHCFLSDRVTKEVDVTGLCSFLPIDNYAIWADEICRTDISDRKDTSQQIINAGYDIHTTAKWLEEFYLKCADR